jgi:hypothetical protein
VTASVEINMPSICIFIRCRATNSFGLSLGLMDRFTEGRGGVGLWDTFSLRCSFSGDSLTNSLGLSLGLMGRFTEGGSSISLGDSFSLRFAFSVDSLGLWGSLAGTAPRTPQPIKVIIDAKIYVRFKREAGTFEAPEGWKGGRPRAYPAKLQLP